MEESFEEIFISSEASDESSEATDRLESSDELESSEENIPGFVVEDWTIVEEEYSVNEEDAEFTDGSSSSEETLSSSEDEGIDTRNIVNRSRREMLAWFRAERGIWEPDSSLDVSSEDD